MVILLVLYSWLILMIIRAIIKFIIQTEPEGVINGVVVPLVENKEGK